MKKEEIKDLESKIITENDKILFLESVKCLESKTLRAGYIIAWISIVESLKRKISDLANTGDIQSKQSFDKIDKLEKGEKSADSAIITESLAIGLIEKEEYTKLLFFWNQRCLFAHPYEKAPTEDELIFIISQAVDITLGKILEFKKNYINQLILNLINKPHFLPNDYNSIKAYSDVVIPRISKKLHPYFFKNLIAKIGEIKDDEIKKKFIDRLKCFSNQLIKQTDEDLGDTKWRMEDLAINHTYEFFIGISDIDIWQKLTERVRSIILEYIIQPEKKPEHFIVTRLLSSIYKKNLLSTENEKKFENLISNLNILDSYEFYKNDTELANRLIQELDSGDYYRQQDVIIILKNDNGQEFQNSLNLNQCMNIGRKIAIASSYGCYEAQDVMNNITYKFNKKFQAGFYVGIFSSNDMTFRLSNFYSKFLNHIDNSEPTILKNVMNYININKKKEFNQFALDDFKNKIEIVESKNKLKPQSIDFLKSILEEYE